MNIRITGADRRQLVAAQEALAALAQDWGATPSLRDAPAPPAVSATGHRPIDPVAVTALIVSLPSSLLAVADLTDRLRKRRRADELAEHARRLQDHQIEVAIETPAGTVIVATLTPDQLLDLVTGMSED